MRRKEKMDSRIEKQELTESYREKMKGKKYRHFKGGLYEVIDIAIHSENEEQIVIYKSCDNPSFIWARPLNMFISEVDRDKYPDVKQKMRFELVE